MIATAKCWVHYHGVWHKCGESFKVDESDMDGIVGACTLREEKKTPTPKTAEPVEQTADEKPKRTRKKVTE